MGSGAGSDGTAGGSIAPRPTGGRLAAYVSRPRDSGGATSPRCRAGAGRDAGGRSASAIGIETSPDMADGKGARSLEGPGGRALAGFGAKKRYGPLSSFGLAARLMNEAFAK